MDHAAVAEDRRRSPRVPLQTIAIITAGKQEYVLLTRDVSETGAFLFSRLRPIEIPVGSRLHIELLGRRHTAKFAARVARNECEFESRPSLACGIGIAIEFIDESNLAQLMCMLADPVRNRA